MRGPGWNYNETEHSYGANVTDVAVIADHDCLQTEKKVTVCWSDGNRFWYRWGNDGKFDVQIYH